MAARWLIGLAISATFSFAACRGQDALPGWNADADKAWWTAHPTPDTWSQAADALDAQLAAEYKRHGANVFSSPDFQGWTEHLVWLRLGLDDQKVLNDPASLQTFIALGEDATLSHLLVEKLKPVDVKQAALENLLRLAQANPADLHEYAALGVAYSLVFDEPFPSDWPHSQVSPSAVPIGDLDIVKRFQFYVQANRDKKTELDLTQLSVDNLKYLVDSEVQLSELAYGQQNKVPYDHLEKAFFSINYDTARVSSGNAVFKWRQPTYTLHDIETDGGICVDQAYYASEIGKARGIPTIYFTGLGTDGGHAWFGYLMSSGKWNLDCGRYASQNYPKGYALDPQTWQEVKDTTLEDLTKNGGTNANYPPAWTALTWARLHPSDPAYRQILDDARGIMPELAETWQTEADYLDKNDTIDLQDKKDFYQKWFAQFGSYPDMKVEGQKRLVALLKKANDSDADSVNRDIVLENRSTGFDLGIEGSSGTIEDKIKAQDWDGAKIEFERSVRDFKEQGGSNLYYHIIRPYVFSCMSVGRLDQAADGVKFTQDRMSFNDGSLVSEQFDALKAEVDAMRGAVDAMKKWLDEIDNGNYDQGWSDSAQALQAVTTSSEWTDKISKMRSALGRCTSRTLTSSPRHGTGYKPPGGQKIEGNLYLVHFDSVFDSQPHAQETVCFKQDTDGKWRAIDYSVKASDAAPAAASN